MEDEPSVFKESNVLEASCSVRIFFLLDDFDVLT